jgi:hypothetical protein
MAKRIGPKMIQARNYVARNPGCAILPVADHVGPNGSRGLGYAIVWRAIKAGLITAKRGVGNRYALTAVSL